MNKMKRPHYLLIPLCVLRSSTYLFISVCYTGSAEGPQHGETPEMSSQRAPAHIKFNFCTGSSLLVTVTYDDILIRCPLFFPSAAHQLREPVQILTTTFRINPTAPQDGGTEQGGGGVTIIDSHLRQTNRRTRYSTFYTLRTY